MVSSYFTLWYYIMVGPMMHSLRARITGIMIIWNLSALGRRESAPLLSPVCSASCAQRVQQTSPLLPCPLLCCTPAPVPSCAQRVQPRLSPASLSCISRSSLTPMNKLYAYLPKDQGEQPRSCVARPSYCNRRRDAGMELEAAAVPAGVDRVHVV